VEEAKAFQNEDTSGRKTVWRTVLREHSIEFLLAVGGGLAKIGVKYEGKGGGAGVILARLGKKKGSLKVKKREELEKTTRRERERKSLRGERYRKRWSREES